MIKPQGTYLFKQVKMAKASQLPPVNLKIGLLSLKIGSLNLKFS
jgi:hypothetical protein